MIAENPRERLLWESIADAWAEAEHRCQFEHQSPKKSFDKFFEEATAFLKEFHQEELSEMVVIRTLADQQYQLDRLNKELKILGKLNPEEAQHF